MIKLSIIVPIYNGEEFIQQALDSIPVREDIEVICINDGSTDNTLNLLKNYKRLPIIIYTYDKNMGIGFATNIGIKASKGEYITGLDIDDCFITDKFNDCLNLINLKADIYSFPYLRKDGRMWPVRATVGLPSKWIKKSFIGDIKWRTDIRHAVDYHFLTELRNKNPNEVFLDKFYYKYNYPREGSMDWKRTHEK